MTKFFWFDELQVSFRIIFGNLIMLLSLRFTFREYNMAAPCFFLQSLLVFLLLELGSY